MIRPDPLHAPAESMNPAPNPGSSLPTAAPRLPTFVVIGSGYGGALAAARLAHVAPNVHVVLVAPGGALTERVRLHETLAWGRTPWVPVRALVGSSVEVVEAQVLQLDGASRTLQTSAGPMRFDGCIVATGSAPAPGLPSEGANAVRVWSVTAEAMMALHGQLPELAARRARVAVCGGGLTAVELAAELAYAWPALKVSLLSPEPPVDALGEAVSMRVMRQLQRLGVDWHRGRAVAADAQGVRTLEGHCAADAVVHATGLVGQRPATSDAGVTSGRVAVDAFLQWPGMPGVFVAGDAAAWANGEGTLGAMGCKLAMPMAAHAADNLVRWSRSEALQAFRWVDPGTTIALGPRFAVGCTGPRPGRAPLAMGGRWLAPVKHALCAWVVAAIRWQAHGWMHYRWFHGSAPNRAAALQNVAVG